MPALSLSEQGAEVGRIVNTLKSTADNEVHLSQGTISAHYDHRDNKPDTVTAHLLQHNAMMSVGEFGMPLFNECGQVVALNIPDPDTVDRLFRRVTDPEDVVFALRAGDIIAALGEWNIPSTVVDDVCLSAVERAELSAIEKERQAQAAEEARQQTEEEKQEAEGARQQAEEEKQAAEEARQQAEEEKQEAEAAKQQAEAEKQEAEQEKQSVEETLRLKQEEVEAIEEARLEAE